MNQEVENGFLQSELLISVECRRRSVVSTLQGELNSINGPDRTRRIVGCVYAISSTGTLILPYRLVSDRKYTSVDKIDTIFNGRPWCIQVLPLKMGTRINIVSGVT